MNCKPNDIAIIVGIGGFMPFAPAIGKLVRVAKLTVPSPKFGPMWLLEAPFSVAGLTCDAVADCVLRPIRDSGDDALDETLQWLPVPSREREAA